MKDTGAHGAFPMNPDKDTRGLTKLEYAAIHIAGHLVVESMRQMSELSDRSQDLAVIGLAHDIGPASVTVARKVLAACE